MTIELLQQVRLLDPIALTDRVADLLIDNGVIAAIAPTITDYPTPTQVRDCQGLVLGPGLVDLYSHSGEPGFEQRETLESLRRAAAAGGFTRVAVLPDTEPAIDNPGTIAGWHQSRAGSTPHLHLWAALTLRTQGQQMTELAELSQADIIGFTDGQPLNHLPLVRRLLEYLRPIQKPVALWACDRGLAGQGVMREGSESIQFGLPGVPAIAETSALAALLECVAAIGTPVHLMRISTARSIELIRAAKAQGVPITASVTWMHLLLDSQDIRRYDPHLRLSPPLGNPADRLALVQAVQDGTIDAIAIDHTPYTYEEKTVAFAEAPCGAIGLELALPLLWQQLVESGTWSALDLWRSLSTQPLHCLGREPQSIAPGQPAELTLFDPGCTWIVDQTTLESRSSNTPWLGKPIPGRVTQIWC
jgi:dihydroorotase